ncbi:MAG: HEAT repeat domain-containing protein [Gammaproteobacteria bacterium]|nr:HEAT repeat domain-containing protein [Gammaproteobacteria bacterium]
MTEQSLHARRINEDVMQLCECLDPEYPTLLCDVLTELSRLGEKATPALPEIVPLCFSADDKVRTRAIATLAEIRSRSESPVFVLMQALYDDCVDVRRYAAAGLALMSADDLQFSGLYQRLNYLVRHENDFYVREQLREMLKTIIKKM